MQWLLNTIGMASNSSRLIEKILEELHYYTRVSELWYENYLHMNSIRDVMRLKTQTDSSTVTWMGRD